MQNFLPIHFSLTFILAVVVALVSTALVRHVALRVHAIDVPNDTRKIHTKPIPLFGGVALFVSVVVTMVTIASAGWLSDSRTPWNVLIGIMVAGGILIIGGLLDDRFNIPWWMQLLFTVCAAILATASGLRIGFVTNPSGGLPLIIGGAVLGIPVSAVLVTLWLLATMYTTKLLDGVDGLASTVSLIGMLVLFGVSLRWDAMGATTSFLALAGAGAAFGFLFWNWHPARIFLGEGGSTFLGFMLGVLAVISGGKIATALLVMGLPLLDVVWIVMRRATLRRHIAHGDDQHLHFRLLRAGMSQRQVVLFLAVISLIYGASSFFVTTRGKMIALVLLTVFMVILVSILIRKYERPKHR